MTHVVAKHRGIIGVDEAPPVVNGHIEGVDAGHVQHGNQQSCLVFAIAVAVAKDIARMVGLMTAYAAHHNEVANIFLNCVRNTIQPSVEVGRSGDQRLHIGCYLRCGGGSIGFQQSKPLADSTPLLIGPGNGGISPLHAHTSRQGYPLWPGRNVAQIERWHVLQLPPPVIGCNLYRRDCLKIVPGLRMRATGRQINLKRLENDGDAVLNFPKFLAKIRLQQFFRFADYGCPDIDGGRNGNTRFFRSRA